MVVWRLEDATFLYNLATVIIGEFFDSLIILLTECGGKINMGPLPGKFVTELL